MALVTGAARGIGAATAALFAARGAALCVCDREPGGLVGDGAGGPTEGPGGTPVLSRLLDVRDTDAIDALVADAVAAFGHLDFVVHNAGGTFAAPFADVSVKGEAALIAENFTHITHLTRVALPHLGPGSAIVMVTSIEAHRAAPGFAVYAAMKAGLANLTATLALELAPRGIRVNAVAPDAISSGGEQVVGDEFAGTGIPYHPSGLPPLGRHGDPVDAAGPILFLCSDLARFVTGISLLVDGGNWAAGGWHRTQA